MERITTLSAILLPSFAAGILGCAEPPDAGRTAAAITDPDYTDDDAPFDFPQVVVVG